MLDRLVEKVSEKILELPVRVEKPRTNRSLGYSKDLRDLCVWHSLYIEHRYNGAVIMRQVLHRFVQPFL